MSKFYIRLVKENGLRFNTKRFPSRKEAEEYLWQFYRCKDGIFKTIIKDNNQWFVILPTLVIDREDSSYRVIKQFSLQEEALIFARENLAADSQGCLDLIDEI